MNDNTLKSMEVTINFSLSDTSTEISTLLYSTFYTPLGTNFRLNNTQVAHILLPSGLLTQPTD